MDLKVLICVKDFKNIMLVSQGDHNCWYSREEGSGEEGGCSR
jgi:hypothetical protein